MTKLDEIRKARAKLKAEMKEIEDEMDQHILDSNAFFAQAKAAMFPALEAIRVAEMAEDHAAQLDEMDRVINEEAKVKADKEAKWAEEDKKGRY